MDMNRSRERRVLSYTVDSDDTRLKHYLKYRSSTAFNGIWCVTFPVQIKVMNDSEKEEIFEKGLSLYREK